MKTTTTPHNGDGESNSDVATTVLTNKLSTMLATRIVKEKCVLEEETPHNCKSYTYVHSQVALALVVVGVIN